MNQAIADRLRSVLTGAGIHVRGEDHRGGLSVEFTTSPPFCWTYAQCDAAVDKVLDAPLSTPDRFGCHPDGRTPGPIKKHFSTGHDRGHSYWRFRLESCPETIAID